MSVVKRYRRLLDNGPLTRLLLGEFISAIGDRMYQVAFLVLLYRETQDLTVLAVVGAARLVPYVLLSIPAGVIADRFDRRYVLLASDIGRGVCMVILAALVATDGPIAAIAAIALVAGAFSPFFNPAIRALIPSLVRDETEFGPANSAWATLDFVAMVVGPALAGIVIAVASAEVAFVLNAATYALIGFILLSLPTSRARPIAPTDAEDRIAPTARIRVRDVVNLPAVSGLGVQEAVIGIAFGALDVLIVVLAIDTYRGGEAATGYLTAAIGVGGVLGSLIAGVVIVRRQLRPVIAVTVAVFGAALVLLGVAPDLTVAFVAITLVSVCALVLDVVRTTIFQLVVPDAYRGRFSGVLMTTGVGSEALGVLVVPLLASAFGLGSVMNVLAFTALGGTALALVLLGGATRQAEASARPAAVPTEGPLADRP